MATSKSVPSAGSGVEGILSLLNAFGQKQSSTSTANTAPLENVLQQLQTSPDGTALLESIFQQAAGQIPRLQTAYGNAVGARSGGNSSVQSALNELMKQTALAGQQQIVQQQQNNQNMQLQAANGIAQASRGTNTTSQPNVGFIGKALGGLQALSAATSLYDKGKKLYDRFGAASDAGSQLGSGLFDAGFDWQNFTPSALDVNTGASLLGDAGSGLAGFGTNFLTDLPSFTEGLSTAGDAATNLGENAGSIWDTITGWFGFADGGLVGRDGEEMGESSHTSKAEKAEPEGYANGGVVRSGGGRRSSAPTYYPVKPVTTAAIQGNGNPLQTGTAGVPASGVNPLGPSSGFSLGGFGGGVALPSRAGYSVVEGSMQAKPAGEWDYTDSGSTTTGIPNWAIGVASSLLGLNPLIGFALKEGNKYLAANDPTNPKTVAAINGSDFESDSAMSAGSVMGGSSGARPGKPKGMDFSADEGGGPSSLEDFLSWFQASPWEEQSGAGSPGGGFGGNSGGFGGFDAGGFGGGFGGGGGYGSYGGYSSSGGGNSTYAIAGHKDGGKIEGPGTGTSDSIPAKLSKGEYVISADVVSNVGVDFFDNLQKMFHVQAPGST